MTKTADGTVLREFACARHELIDPVAEGATRLSSVQN
jgi:hypothetical protein